MASDMNMVIIGGRLCADAELKYTKSGSAIGEFRMASNKFFKKQGAEEFEKQVTFITVTFFGKSAEHIVDWARKGVQVVVKGSLRLEQWEGSDGIKKERMKIMGDEVVPVKDTRPSADSEAAAPAQTPTPAPADDEDQIPF